MKEKQEPVGGMKSKEEIFEKHIHVWTNNDGEKFIAPREVERNNLPEAIKYAMQEYAAQFTPPPAPIKTEGEENQMRSADYWFEKSLHIPVAKKWQRFGHADIVKELIKEMMEYYATPPPSPVGIDQQVIDALTWALNTLDYHNERELGQDVSIEVQSQEARKALVNYSASLPSSSVTGEEVKYIAMSPNNTDLIQGWYKDAKGSNFQLIKVSLPVTGESEAIEKAIIEELESLLSSGVHPEYLPEKINDRISELKGDKSYT